MQQLHLTRPSKEVPRNTVIRFAAGKRKWRGVAAGSCLRATGLGVVDHRGGDGSAFGQPCVEDCDWPKIAGQKSGSWRPYPAASPFYISVCRLNNF